MFLKIFLLILLMFLFKTHSGTCEELLAHSMYTYRMIFFDDLFKRFR